MRRWCGGAAVVLMVLAASAFAADSGPAEVPKVREPKPERPETLEKLPEARPGIRVFPVPEIVTSPTEGLTLGALGVVLFTGKQRQIRRIVAPDVRYNKIFGVYPTFRLFEYPNRYEKYFLGLGKSTKIDEKYEFTYNGSRIWWRENFELDVRLMYERDSRERFYGIGNHTDESAESNYTGKVFLAHGVLGFRLRESLVAQVGWRARKVEIGRGGVDDVPPTVTAFPDAPGIEGKTLVGPSVGVFYDTRDSTDVPSRGVLAGLTLEWIDRAFGSSTSFGSVSFEARGFRPVMPGRDVVLGVRGSARYMIGGERAPFYELSSLGGTDNLRGFGTHRFRDRHRLGGQAELRWRFYTREIFGVRAALEAAPFFEVGKVFDDWLENPLRGLHPVGGAGIRAVVRPQVVAFVDVGVGEEGPAVFTGIDYPF